MLVPALIKDMTECKKFIYFVGPSPAGASPSAIPYKLDFKASVTGPKVKKITSESDQIQVNYGDTETKVRGCKGSIALSESNVVSRWVRKEINVLFNL